MVKDKPLILLSNDDGIRSPGLKALAEAVSDLGEVLIVAPDRQQTSMGRAYPKDKKLGIIEKMPEDLFGQGIEAYSVIGSPAYCVAHGVLEIASRKPDLCISGINYGENLGTTLSYSGTVGAALQAAEFGVPSIAMSRPASLSQIRGDYADLDWTYAKAVIRRWTKQVIRQGMPKGAPILNINVPEVSSDPGAFEYTVQSNKDMYLFEKAVSRDFEQPFTLHSRKRDCFDDVEKNSDIWATCVDGVTSVTPIACNFTFKEE